MILATCWWNKPQKDRNCSMDHDFREIVKTWYHVILLIQPSFWLLRTMFLATCSFLTFYYGLELKHHLPSRLLSVLQVYQDIPGISWWSEIRWNCTSHSKLHVPRCLNKASSTRRFSTPAKCKMQFQWNQWTNHQIQMDDTPQLQTPRELLVHLL